jgi:hypothetical protein
VKARWTNPSGVEGIPLVTAGTRPAIVLSRPPIAQRAPDARTQRFVAFVPLYLFVGRCEFVSGSFCDCAHQENYERETAVMP